MKLLKISLLSLLLLPRLSHAQTFQAFLNNFVIFVSNTLIPFLIVIAFLFFVYNAIRYFVFEGSNEDGQEKAKSLALYGVFAFVLIIIFWGIVNLLASSIGLDGENAPASDYVEMGGGARGGTNPNCAQNNCGNSNLPTNPSQGPQGPDFTPVLPIGSPNGNQLPDYNQGPNF